MRKKLTPFHHSVADHLSDILPARSNALVRWSKKPIGNAVVFIHGFGGHPTNTWNEFQHYLLYDKYFSGDDIFFFTYDSRKVWLSDSAHSLHFLLDILFNHTNKLYSHLLDIFPDRSGSNLKNYKKALLVAHSAGAAVLRRALLDQCKHEELLEQNSPTRWVQNTNSILFAPAHTGANITALASIAFDKLNLGIISPAVLYFLPVLKDLQPNSKFLTALWNDAEKFTQNNNNKCLCAKRIIRAMNDKIVERTDFICDLPATDIVEKDHRNVCKPNSYYETPYNIVEEIRKEI